MKKHLLHLSFLVLAFAGLLIATPVPAGADAAAIVVRSRYLNPATQQWRNEIIWRFVPAESGRFEVFQKDHTAADMILTYSAQGRLLRVEDRLTGMYSRENGPTDALTLSWGFPLPFDDLNPADAAQTAATVYRQVGETRFAHAVVKETREISLDEAAAAGMLADSRPADLAGGRVLKLITVQDGKAIRVRQLWAEGDTWWLYEETETRRSWRVVE